MKLSGYTITRDCIKGDYCFELTIRCLSAVCDEVVIADAGSTDGTRNVLLELYRTLGNVRILDYEREDCFNNKALLTRWMNWTREQLHGSHQLYLDADEIIDPEQRERIRSQAITNHPFWCRRYNFWGDHRHVTPPGVVCGDEVVRLAPQHYWMPSDEPCIPEARIRDDAIKYGPDIFHYGFIRKPEGFLAKSAWLQPALVGSFDDRLKRAMQTGEDWRALAPCPKTPLPFHGKHPSIALNWLKDRGYEI